jgi:hypothetical protein
MRRLAVLVVAAASVLSCTNSQVAEQTAFAPPAPTPPPLRAPICARPAEKTAIDVSALVSEQLQLVAITCRTRDKYNALIPRLRPALATKEKNLSAFFKRAYGKRGQAEQDEYITELANLQSQLALKTGDRFCSINSSMFDQIMPLSNVNELAAYARSKPIQQALAVSECPTAPRRKGQQQASR